MFPASYSVASTTHCTIAADYTPYDMQAAMLCVVHMCWWRIRSDIRISWQSRDDAGQGSTADTAQAHDAP